MDCPFDCTDFNRYRVDLPYPRPVITEPNRRYACLISDAFSGAGSEMTAITQYGIHRFYLADLPEAYTAYLYIAASEMVHWQLLGQLVLELGSSPQYASLQSGRWWIGSNPAYRCTPPDIFESDIKGERDAIAHYERLLLSIDDPEIRGLIRRIILDEEHHIRVLTALAAKI